MKVNVYGLRGFPEVQGGVEKHSQELYPLLANNRILFKIFRRKPYVISDKRYRNIEFKDLWTIKSKYLEAIIHSFLAVIYTIKDKPDLVHIHNIGPASTLILLKLFGLKTIVTYHSANYEHKKWDVPGAKLIIRLMEKITFLFADKIIFISDAQRKKVASHLSKAITVPNGTPTFNKLVPEISLSQFNIMKKRYILSVGRIVREKRFEDLIRAFKYLSNNYKLVIAGSFDNDATYFNKLKDISSENIVFTGNLTPNNLKLLYDNAYCFVLPSENEGMPIVLLEAMSFGLCPLVSNIKENLDVIKEDYGYSFKTKNVKDLKKQLEFMIKNPESVKEKGLKAKQYVKKTYDWDVIAKKTLKVYEEALG